MVYALPNIPHIQITKGDLFDHYEWFWGKELGASHPQPGLPIRMHRARCRSQAAFYVGPRSCISSHVPDCVLAPGKSLLLLGLKAGGPLLLSGCVLRGSPFLPLACQRWSLKGTGRTTSLKKLGRPEESQE